MAEPEILRHELDGGWSLRLAGYRRYHGRLQGDVGLVNGQTEDYRQVVLSDPASCRRWADEAASGPGRPEAGTLVQALLQMIESVLAALQGGGTSPAPDRAEDGRPALDVGHKDLAVVTPSAWGLMASANDPPRLFQHGDTLTRLVVNDRGEPRLVPVGLAGLRQMLTRAAFCYVPSPFGPAPAFPPRELLEDMQATPEPPVPVIERIVRAPVFSPDDTLQTEPGYHAAGRVYYQPLSGLAIPPVSMSPPVAEITEAKRLLVDELCGDFPFAEEADRAHAVGLILAPFVRSMIGGATPNHLIEAPEAGTGKGLLADVALLPFLGTTVPKVAPARSEEEWRKRITSLLRSGGGASCIDNVRGVLDSGTLAAALTATIWEDRLLGQSQLLHLPVRLVWVTTGNNVLLSTEIARRCVRIRLDAKVEQPWLRDPKTFRHRDLIGWATTNRGKLIWAALTLVRAWLAAGRPRPGRSLGSYEEWSEVVGGVLETAAIPGFLGNVDRLYERAAEEAATWRRFTATWWARFQGTAVTTGDLFPLALDTDGLELKGGTEQGQRTSLGSQLKAQEGRIVEPRDEVGQTLGRYQISACGERQGARLWKLARTDIS